MTWNESEGALRAELTFADFAEAFAFMTRVGLVAQKQGHHPDMAISCNKVNIPITTHDAGNTVTDNDRKLAEAIDAMRTTCRHPIQTSLGSPTQQLHSD